MKYTLHFLGLSLIAILAYSLAGCSPVYYASNAQNVPLLKEKHDFSINAGLTATEDVSGPDLQVAYAAGKNLGIIANAAYLKSGPDGRWKGKGKIAEAGFGYFAPIGKRLVFEIYGGAGLGVITNERRSSGYSFDLNFSKYFIQPNFGFTTHFIEVAFSPKFAVVRFEHGFVENYEPDASGHYQFFYTGKRNFLAMEPGITVRGGWKAVMLQAQVVNSFQDIPQSQDLSVNISLAIKLANRYKKVAQ